MTACPGQRSLPSCTELLPFVRMFYGQPSTYSWWDDQGRCRDVKQGEGRRPLHHHDALSGKDVVGHDCQDRRGSQWYRVESGQYKGDWSQRWAPTARHSRARRRSVARRLEPRTTRYRGAWHAHRPPRFRPSLGSPAPRGRRAVAQPAAQTPGLAMFVAVAAAVRVPSCKPCLAHGSPVGNPGVCTRP